MNETKEAETPVAAEQESGLVSRTIVTRCRLTHNDGRQEFFGPGVHEVPEDVANHWFFAAHTDNPPPSDVRPGTPEFIIMKAGEDRRRRLLEAAAAQQKADDLRVVSQQRGAAAAAQGKHRVSPLPIEEQGPADEAELQARAQAVNAADAHSALTAAAHHVESVEGQRLAKAAEAVRQDELAKAPPKRRRLVADET